ncbi:hypothetical protein Q2K19_25775 [Micromonospora soli]|uniref:hypothetical protein n=1 Tax=Micromonospora sp. NBRC 110009 TaxID=3061627 RepID=UPI00267321AD|nr:hypothetical protein [Micromonospora sp. NBRC 110009]WKT97557.1 hypothetical protein Q2K19_25775 [Micromonospora sp. NBRC 110009]
MTPLLTAPVIVLSSTFVVLIFVVAYLRIGHADTLLSVITLWIFAAGAVVAAVVGMTNADPVGRFAWALAALLAASAALVPQAASSATAAVFAVRRLLDTSRDVQNLALGLLAVVGVMLGSGAVLSIIDEDVGLFVVAGTACIAVALASLWWSRRRAQLAATLSVAAAAPLVVGATAFGISGDVLSAALFAALAMSFAGAGGATLLSQPMLRGLIALGAAAFAGALFVAGVLDEYGYSNYGYSELTWMLRGAVAMLFLIGGIGMLLKRTLLSAVTATAGATAVALTAVIIWRHEGADWPFYLVYGVVGVAIGVNAVAASPAPGTVRRWSALLTAPRSAPSAPGNP